MLQKRDPEDAKKGEEVISNQNERQKTFLGLLLEAIPLPVFYKDTKGLYTGCNMAFEEYMGFSREEIIGKTVFDMGPREIAEKYAEKDSELFRSGGRQTYQWRVSSRDGKIRDVLFDKSVITAPDGKTLGLVGVITGIAGRKEFVERLLAIEEQMEKILGLILDPGADSCDFTLSDIIDPVELQSLFDDFYKIVPLPMSLIDMQGKILVGIGWQDVCKCFHRVNAESCKNCLESDLKLTADVEPGKFILYKCRNNMWDIATPVMAGERKLGNLFMGQFFFDDDVIDYESFREQARRFGFDEDKYIAALERVPRFSRDTINNAMVFFIGLASYLSAQGISTLGLARSLEQNRALLEDLASSREMFDLFLNSTTEMAFLKNAELRYEMANDAYLKFLGKTRDEVIGRTDLEILPRDLAEQCLKADEEVLRSGKPIVAQESGDGKVFESRKFPISFQDGTTGIGGFIRDVTDLRKAEEALRESEERFRSIFENSTTGLYRTTPDGKILMANPALVRMIGYSSFEDLASRDLSKEGFEPDYPREIFQQRLESEGEIIGLEAAWTRLDGSVISIRESARAVRCPEGKVLYYEGTVEDISQRKQAEETLKKQSLRLENVIRGASVATWEWNLQTGETVINDIWAQIIGYRLEELSPVSVKTWEELIHPEDLERVYERINLHVEGKLPYYDCEIRKKHKNGSWVWVYDRGTIMTRTADGRPLMMFGTYTDITDRKNADEKLRRALQATIEMLTQTVELRDPYTAGHQRRVANLAAAIAAEMGLGPERLEEIRMAGYVHDIGKISVPSEILSKPARLSEIEMNIIREHPGIGRDFIKDVETEWPLGELIYQHHERMDGSGYPQGLKGKDILLEARILCVADVVEAMASHRPYRPALGIEAALDEIEKNRGILYDSQVVDVCLELFREKGYLLIE